MKRETNRRILLVDDTEAIHEDFRKILDPRFSRKRMAEIEPRVRQHANELIDSVIERGDAVEWTAAGFALLIEGTGSAGAQDARLEDGARCFTGVESA